MAVAWTNVPPIESPLVEIRRLNQRRENDKPRLCRIFQNVRDTSGSGTCSKVSKLVTRSYLPSGWMENDETIGS